MENMTSIHAQKQRHMINTILMQPYYCRSTDQIKHLYCTHKANDRNKSTRDSVMLMDKTLFELFEHDNFTILQRFVWVETLRPSQQLFQSCRDDFPARTRCSVFFSVTQHYDRVPREISDQEPSILPP